MLKYLIRLARVNRNKKKRNKRRTVVFDSSSFLFGKKIMEDIEAKLDQMATYLAEIMLSQLGFSFIPSVRPKVIKLRIGGIFTVTVGFPKEDVQDVPFHYYEPLNFLAGENIYGTN